MLGSHCVKHWSSTQTSIALSSGEAEFAGVLRGAGQGLGYQALLKDIGVAVPLRVWTDSTAAVGICSRQGLGGQRHIDTHSLWVQQGIRSGRFSLHKVDGEVNPADLFTKHMPTRERLSSLMRLFGCQYQDGRSAAAPAMRAAAGTKTTMAGELNLNETDGMKVVIPHLMGDEYMRRNHEPIIAAAEPNGANDHVVTDGLLEHGTKIAREIMAEAAKLGRLKVGTTSSRTSTTTASQYTKRVWHHDDDDDDIARTSTAPRSTSPIRAG